MNKVFYILSWFGIISAIAIVFITTLWLVYPYNPLQFATEPHEMITKEVEPGSHVRFELDYCKNSKIGAEVTVSFVDGFIYDSTSIPINIENGCHSVAQSVYVPRAIPPGIYSIKMLYRFKVNPIRTIDIITMSEKFEVIK